MWGQSEGYSSSNQHLATHWMRQKEIVGGGREGGGEMERKYMHHQG